MFGFHRKKTHDLTTMNELGALDVWIDQQLGEVGQTINPVEKLQKLELIKLEIESRINRKYNQSIDKTMKGAAGAMFGAIGAEIGVPTAAMLAGVTALPLLPGLALVLGPMAAVGCVGGAATFVFHKRRNKKIKKFETILDKKWFEICAMQEQLIRDNPKEIERVFPGITAEFTQAANRAVPEQGGKKAPPPKQQPGY